VFDGPSVLVGGAITGKGDDDVVCKGEHAEHVA
jgi:hypothetical protein